MAPIQSDETRDDSTIVDVVFKDQIDGGAIKEGVSPGRVTLGWLRLGKNAENWIEVSSADAGSTDVPDDVVAGSIAEVIARVEAGDVTAADALAAEQAKGDKARSTLVDQLNGIAAAGQEG